jgi:hypothetical protein
MISQDLVQHLQLPTTPHPDPYHLGWVQKDSPRITISRCCVVTFAIGPFRDTVIWDVSPLDCVDILLGLPYQQDRQAVYHAKMHQYHLKQAGCTYVLTSLSITSPLSRTDTTTTHHVTNTNNVSMCLTHHVHPKNLTNQTPPTILPLRLKFTNVSQSPSRRPPPRALVPSIDLIHDASLPNAPSSRLVTQDTIERPLVMAYHSLIQATIKYRYPLPWIASQFSLGAMRKQGGHRVNYQSETLSIAKFNLPPLRQRIPPLDAGFAEVAPLQQGHALFHRLLTFRGLSWISVSGAHKDASHFDYVDINTSTPRTTG